MKCLPAYVIDTSTPESLERDFYAWLNHDDYGLVPSAPSSARAFSPQSPQFFRHSKEELMPYRENSESASPSSFSTSSIESDRQVARSSGRNQLGRCYSPGLPLSMAERENIVKLFQDGWKICDISKQLCITHSCVSKILNRYRATGSVRPKDAKEGRSESPLVIAIRDYKNRLGMCRQGEIREQLIKDGICTRENVPSRSSINHILRNKLEMRRKRK